MTKRGDDSTTIFITEERNIFKKWCPYVICGIVVLVAFIALLTVAIGGEKVIKCTIPG